MNKIIKFCCFLLVGFLPVFSRAQKPKDNCVESIINTWVRHSKEGTIFWDFLRKHEGLTVDYSQGVLIKSTVVDSTHRLVESFRFFTPDDNTLIMTADGMKIDTFSMKLKCDHVLLKKANKFSKANDTIRLYIDNNFPFKFNSLQVYCPPKPPINGFADLYFNFFTYLKTLRLKYYFSILTLASIIILFRYFLKFRFLFSVLQINTIISVIWLGILYGSSFQLRPEYVVMYACDVDAPYFPKFHYFKFSDSILNLTPPISKNTKAFWLNSFEVIFVTNLVFSIWIAWRKHYGQFNFGKIKIIGTIADIFLQFSVPLVILMLGAGYALVILIGTLKLFDSYNFIIFGIASISAYLYWKHILFKRYFYFDSGEQKTFKEFVEEKIKELVS